MTLLVDPPLLVGVGAVTERLVADDRLRAGLQAGATGAVLGAGLGFYTNARWTRRFWPVLHITSGRDWMLGTWFIPVPEPSRVVHAVVALSFAAYPAWTLLGRQLGRSARQRGHRPQVTGRSLAGGQGAARLPSSSIRTRALRGALAP